MTIQERLKLIIKMHNLTASSFADKIGVQRSSLSHIMSGRNKPSMDFIEKTLASFPRVDANWLLTGKQEALQAKSSQMVVIETNEENVKGSLKLEQEQQITRKIEKIIVFYSDGTYEVTLPNAE